MGVFMRYRGWLRGVLVYKICVQFLQNNGYVGGLISVLAGED